MNYLINIKELARKVIPRVLRGERFINIIYSLIAPLSSLNVMFSTFVTKANQKVIYSSQVIYLEKLLNDYFDESERRISIMDLNITTDIAFSNRSEALQNVYFRNSAENTSPAWLFNKNDVFSREFDVSIPIELQTQSEKIASVVDFHKLFDKRFEVLANFEIIEGTTDGQYQLILKLNDAPLPLAFIMDNNPFTITVDGVEVGTPYIIYYHMNDEHQLIIQFSFPEFTSGTAVLISYDAGIFAIRNNRGRVLEEVTNFNVINNN